MTRKAVFSAVFALLIGFVYAAGQSIDHADAVDFTSSFFYMRWVLFGVVACILYWSMDYIRAKQVGQGVVYSAPRKEKHPGWLPISYRLFFLCCWMPAFLASFPGVFSYDAREEWQQVVTGMITTHHPVLHVLLLGGLVEEFGKIAGDYNVGIVLYTLFQMIVMAHVLQQVLQLFDAFLLPFWFRVVALLFYAFSPIMQLYAICATKDVLFTAAQIMFLLYLIRIGYQQNVFFQNKTWMTGFCVSAFFSMTLRNNGLYVTLLLLGIVAVVCRKQWRRIGVLFLGIAVAYFVYVGPIYHILSVERGGVQEMLSVPIQQVARVYHYHQDELDPQDITLLNQVLPKQYLEQYRATVADFVKVGFQEKIFRQQKQEFVRLWLKWAKQYPMTYLSSFLINTVDFWYPGAIVDGYRFEQKSSFFDYQVDEPGHAICFLPRLHTYFERLSHDPEMQKGPLAVLFLSPGWYFVLLLFFFLKFWCDQCYRAMLPMGVLLLTFLTVLLGPMALTRYVLILYYAAPIEFFMFLFLENRHQNADVGKREGGGL